MFLKIIESYQSLADDEKEIIHCIVRKNVYMSIKDLSHETTFHTTKVRMLVEELVKKSLLRKYYSYSDSYVVDKRLLVWLYPLFVTTQPKFGYMFYTDDYVWLNFYLYALLFDPSKISEAERHSAYESLACLAVIFFQPAYDKVIPRISVHIAEQIYRDAITGILTESLPMRLSNPIYQKLEALKYAGVFALRTETLTVEGHFSETLNVDADIIKDFESYPAVWYARAITFFCNDRSDEALELFEIGLKRQRRSYPGSHLPLIPEAAFAYLLLLLSLGETKYLSVFNAVVEEKKSPPSSYYNFFKMLCRICIDSSEYTESLAQNLIPLSDNVYKTVWNLLALDFIGRKPGKNDIGDYVTALFRAYQNGYITIAYEAAAVLQRYTDSPQVAQLYEKLEAQQKYRPLLSRLNRIADWEKQLNSYLSLDAVKAVIRKPVSDKRLAYRFYPATKSAVPVLQSLNSNGAWTSGRNVAMENFRRKKIDCMTDTDRQIAEATSAYASTISGRPLLLLAGHPLIFLNDSNILTEFTHAKPVLSVVKKPKGYVIECDITDLNSEITIVKETNTRYSIYNLTKEQREIIRATTDSAPIPENGREKLLEVLKHFSASIDIQSDLTMDSPAHCVEADPRIRAQLLPMGTGLKAELFVKPFGTYPPYCKPGRGGKMLIANKDGARMQTQRDLKLELQNYEKLMSGIQTIASINIDDNDLITFDDPLDALELIDLLQQNKDLAVVEWPEGEQLKVREKHYGPADMRISVKSGIDWFNLESDLTVDERIVMSVGDMLERIRNDRRSHGVFVELSNGEFIRISKELKQYLTGLDASAPKTKIKSDNRNKKDKATATETEPETKTANKYVVVNRFASLSLFDSLRGIEALKPVEELESPESVKQHDSFKSVNTLKIDKGCRDFRTRHEKAQTVDAEVPSLLQAELRPYQVAGYQWMIRLAEWGAGACLADDMGLGKTVQAIAVLLHRAQKGAALVVSPVSVLQNWINEVNKFAPSLKIKTLHDGDRAETFASLQAGDLLITSYGLLVSEEENIAAQQWATVILDEAHAIKNYNTKTSKAAMSLKANFRIALTGTPLQNHLGEMWNIFEFIIPGLLGDLDSFTDDYIKSGNAHTRSRLKRLITPFILRRTKAAVLEELPPKTEIVRKLTLSDEEMALYENLRREAIDNLEHDEGPQGAKHLKALVEIMRLRQACCNPLMVNPEIKMVSTKLGAFLEIVAELKENGHRALVFSQFVKHLDIVRKALDDEGYVYCYLDGSTPQAKRVREVENFQSGAADLFLISLKAGGLGLNLTAADYVIHLDPWWNPAIEDQASDRAHRIGQTRPVTVYRLVAENTIEEKIIQLHKTKRNLAESLLEGSDQAAKLTLEELIALIRQ
jgi:SNF2 family DNA or RNA helicase